MSLRKLAMVDIAKRNNAQIFVNRAWDGRYQLAANAEYVDGAKAILMATTEIILTKDNLESVAETVKIFAADGGKVLSAKTSEGWKKVTEIHKDQEFSGQKKRQVGADGRKDQERQERALVDIINQLTLSGPVKIPGVGLVSKAEKYDGVSSLGKEPYTDIILYDAKDKPINISCKDETAPSLGGGGLVGLRATVPEFITAFFRAVEQDMKKDGLVHGVTKHYKEVRDYFYQITSESYLKKIFVGTPAMGGPVDYMYIGPMDVKWDGNKFNGKFIPIQEYYRKYTFYLRLRKRDIHASGLVTIDFKTKNKEGFPAIFTSGGKISSRILVDKTTYGNPARKL